MCQFCYLCFIKNVILDFLFDSHFTLLNLKGIILNYFSKKNDFIIQKKNDII